MSDIKNITDILPDGLDESTVQAIFELVDSTIKDQVEEKVNLLEAKVNAFLRTKVDRLKEQALAELSEENEIFRNARLFESVRTLMSLDLNSKDEDSAVSELTSQHRELQEEFDVLTDQTNSYVQENEKLKNTIKVLSNKINLTENTVEALRKEKTQLLEEVDNLEACNQEAFLSSERAIVYSESEKEINEERTYKNEFLTDEVMKFMPLSPQ